MVDSLPDIIIRPLDTRKDLKEVQMLVGMFAMEQLAIANRRAYTNPWVISAWLVFASIIIQWLHLWPTGSGLNGILGYLAPFPPLACTAVPVLFAIDWLHRPHFEKMLREKVKTLTSAVSRPPSDSTKQRVFSLVMEYKKSPIGYILLQPCSTSTRKCYRITHFHVDSPYRHIGVGHDLLAAALKDPGSSGVEVICVTTQLTPYVTECLRGVGFKPDQEVTHVWDSESEKEIRGSESVDVERERVFLVDARRIGWKLSRK